VNKLTITQQLAVNAGARSFLFGPAGSGKTTSIRHRFRHLVHSGNNPYNILVLLAEHDHVTPFEERFRQQEVGPYSDLSIYTYSGLARQMIDLFWPLIARPAGFDRPHHPPKFLSYDLAQLLMAKLVAPHLDEGAFATLTIRRQQIISQILDTLNRAAFNGLSLEQALDRQLTTWAGSISSRLPLQDAALVARKFRQYCYEQNLLDLSLVIRVFESQLALHSRFRDYFSERYRHLLVDNLEEQTPSGQAFISSLMESMESVSLAYDRYGGYKRFLSADPEGALELRHQCDEVIEFSNSLVSNIRLEHLANLIENKLLFKHLPIEEAGLAVHGSVSVRFRREMIIGVIDHIKQLLANNIRASEIALIAPYLDGGLRFNLAIQLGESGMPYRFLRRRALPRDEPRIRAWLTWLALAHSNWDLQLQSYDIAEALTLSIDSLDPVRAHLVTRYLFRPDIPGLIPSSECPESVVERIGDHNLSLVDDIRRWLENNGNDRLQLDSFLHRLFHELLGQPRFNHGLDLNRAAACAWLVRAANQIRRYSASLGLETPAEIGRSLIEGIDQGLVSSQPPEYGSPPDPDGLIIATIYSFLLHGQSVRYQIWLDCAATGWWDIPRQPLSNAFVLNHRWPVDRQWTMDEDIKIRNQLLSRLIRGVTNRCSDGIILANSDLDRRGFGQDGPLWRALYPVRNVAVNKGRVET